MVVVETGCKEIDSGREGSFRIDGSLERFDDSRVGGDGWFRRRRKERRLFMTQCAQPSLSRREACEQSSRLKCDE